MIMSESQIIKSHLRECVLLDVAQIIWEYAREFRVLLDDHIIVVKIHCSDGRRDVGEPFTVELLPSAKYDYVVAGIRFVDSNITSWISYAYNDTAGNSGCSCIWSAEFASGNRIPLDGEIVNYGHNWAWKDAILQHTTIFDRNWRKFVLNELANTDNVRSRADAINMALDMLHADWAAEMTRHW